MNKKYKLVSWDLDIGKFPEKIQDLYDLSDDDLIARYPHKESDIIDDTLDNALIEYFLEKEKLKDEISNYIRSWFGDLNKKFNTEFPSNE